MENLDKEKISADFLNLMSKVDADLSIEENILALFRSDKMCEFVEPPSKREMTMIVNSAVSELNAVNPVTDLTITDFLKNTNLYQVLLRMSLIGAIKMIIVDYTHSGIPDTSIEDLPVPDRQPRYENYLQLLNEDQLKNNCSNFKKAMGIGHDVDEGVARGSIRDVNRHNDFNRISPF